jgi:hypothetical protein
LSPLCSRTSTSPDQSSFGPLMNLSANPLRLYLFLYIEQFIPSTKHYFSVSPARGQIT